MQLVLTRNFVGERLRFRSNSLQRLLPPDDVTIFSSYTFPREKYQSYEHLLLRNVLNVLL